MSLTHCAGCNRPFTPAGYSRHLSMTKRPICRAIYDRHRDRSVFYNGPVVPSPEVSNLSAYHDWLGHAS
jgi:hypothetical protein